MAVLRCFWRKNGHGPVGVKPSILVVSWQLDIWGIIRGRRRPGPPRPWPHYPSPRPPETRAFSRSQLPLALHIWDSLPLHARTVLSQLPPGPGQKHRKGLTGTFDGEKQEMFLPAYGPCFLALYVCTYSGFVLADQTFLSFVYWMWWSSCNLGWLSGEERGSVGEAVTYLHWKMCRTNWGQVIGELLEMDF